MNHLHNFFRKLRSILPPAVVRLIRSTKIPLMLFGVCCYQFYHYQRIKTATNFRSQLPPKKLVLEPFSYELYDSIKDSENVIMLLDMGYTEDFENRLHGILSDLAQATASNPRKLRILRLRFESLAEKEEFEKRCNIKLPY